MGMIRRIMEPGCTFDYVLLLVGKQGIGKTSFFRLIGGPWYKSYTGALDNKDFYLALRGAAIVDLDEGAALYQSEAIKIKSIITETHDEYRAPYDRLMKKYPRRFVFSMSTNDTEPFRDSTGNRRYWAVQSNEPVNFEWIAQNREQLFAEAYHYYKTNETLPEVPFDIAAQTQEDYLPQDVWTDRMSAILRKQEEYCRGDVDFSITLPELYMQMFPDANLERVTKRDEMRLSTMLKRAGFEKRRVMIERERSMRWYLLPERAAELALNNAQSTRLPMEDEFGV
jgi:predicted P-loop ATPase